MAKRKLCSTYSLLPEGEQILRIKEIDDSKYDEFDKLTVILENEKGKGGACGWLRLRTSRKKDSTTPITMSAAERIATMRAKKG